MVKILFGLSVAIATPFDKKNEIELNEFRNHISYLISYNIKSFTFFGTTGEGPSISLKEKIKSLEYLLSQFSLQPVRASYFVPLVSFELDLFINKKVISKIKNIIGINKSV